MADMRSLLRTPGVSSFFFLIVDVKRKMYSLNTIQHLRSDGAAFIRFRKGNHPSKVVEADQGAKNRILLLLCVVIISIDYWM